jgi:hypothetical protein
MEGSGSVQINSDGSGSTTLPLRASLLPQELNLSLEDLKKLPRHTVVAAVQCSGNRRQNPLSICTRRFVKMIFFRYILASLKHILLQNWPGFGGKLKEPIRIRRDSGFFVTKMFKNLQLKQLCIKKTLTGVQAPCKPPAIQAIKNSILLLLPFLGIFLVCLLTKLNHDPKRVRTQKTQQTFNVVISALPFVDLDF